MNEANLRPTNCLQDVVERVNYSSIKGFDMGVVLGYAPGIVNDDAKSLLEAIEESGSNVFNCQVEGCDKTFNLANWHGVIIKQRATRGTAKRLCAARNPK